MDISAVKNELIKITPQVATANHLIMAYRFTDSGGKLRENFDSDGDFGAGIELLKFMRNKYIMNCVYFATRHCSPGYNHIGKRRFNHVNELCSLAQQQIQVP